MNSYLVKWRGRQSGPYSLSDIRAKLATQEISNIHEVQVNGQWVTVRTLLKSIDQAPVVAAPPAERSRPIPVVSAAQPSFDEVETGLVASPPLSNPSVPAPPSVPSNVMNPMGPILNPGRRLLVYGGFWARALAYSFDYLFVSVIPVLGLSMITKQYLLDWDPLTASLLGLCLGIIQWLYFAGMESSGTRATLGKMMVGLVVTDENGRQISFGQATGRHFAKILSVLMLFSGFFLAAFSRKKQAFHDLLAGCTVNFSFREDRILEGLETNRSF